MGMDSNYLNSAKHHALLWKEWLEDKDLYNRVKLTIENRRSFLNLLKRHINYLIKGKERSLKILEEGCGTAIDSCLLKKEYPDIDFYAVDLTSESIELAAKISGLLNVSLKLEMDDVTSTKFESDYFDMVFSQGLVEHFLDPFPVLSEQRRILKEDGLSIISVPQKYSLFTIYKKLKMLFGKWEHGWEREYTWRGLANLGAKAGFELIEIDGYGFTIEDFLRSGIRKIDLSKLGKAMRKRFCKNLVGAFKK